MKNEPKPQYIIIDGFNKSKLQDLVEWELIEAGSVSAIDEGVSTE